MPRPARTRCWIRSGRRGPTAVPIAVPARIVPTLTRVPTIAAMQDGMPRHNPRPMARTDILLVSLGGTAGLRIADDALAASMRRAGASVATVRARAAREPRTFALTDLAWAVPARRAAAAALANAQPRAIVYSTTTAALLWPAPGAIRFDAPAAGNRPGRHGVWQRPAERRRFAQAALLVPWSAGALDEAPAPRADALVVPVPVAPSDAPEGE